MALFSIFSTAISLLNENVKNQYDRSIIKYEILKEDKEIIDEIAHGYGMDLLWKVGLNEKYHNILLNSLNNKADAFSKDTIDYWKEIGETDEIQWFQGNNVYIYPKDLFLKIQKDKQDLEIELEEIKGFILEKKESR